MSRIFLLDALDFVASYLFDRNVVLDAVRLGYAPVPSHDETSRFLVDIEARHVIACAARLKDVLLLIEKDISTSRGRRRELSKGDLNGRLDFPRYIARKYETWGQPHLYPIFVNDNTAKTPENVLTKKVIVEIANQLGHNPYPVTTAEGNASQAMYSWLRTHLHKYPWSALQVNGSTDYLYHSTYQRVHKQQTGNQFGYTALLEWFREWRADVKNLNREAADRIVDGLLAFPQGEFFWNKVFEIWCLKEIAESCLRCGCDIVQGPVSLNRRTQEPIYRMLFNGCEASIWFQRQKPLTDRGKARWIYATNGQHLRGIPDIVILCDKHPPLLIDAKYRRVDTDTRSEETYKMLGYAENYRHSLSLGSQEGILQGVLMFIGTTNNETLLHGPMGGRLTLITVEETLKSRATTRNVLDNSIRSWLIQ